MAGVTAASFLVKQPSELRTYTMDFGALLGTGTINTITSITSELRGGGASDLVLGGGNIVESDKKVSFTISGGTHRNVYRVEVIIVASDSSILEGDGLLKISEI